MQSGVMREFGWPEQRIWGHRRYFSIAEEFKEYLERQDVLELTKLFETLRGYHGIDIITRLLDAEKLSIFPIINLIELSMNRLGNDLNVPGKRTALTSLYDLRQAIFRLLRFT